MSPLLLGTGEIAVLVIAGRSVGRRWMRCIGIDDTKTDETDLFAVLLGVGALQYGPFLLFAVGLGKPVILAWALVLLLLVSLLDFVPIIRRVRMRPSGLTLQAPPRSQPVSSVRTPREQRSQRLLAIFLAALFGVLGLLVFVRALCPPTEGDALSYHLVAPQRFLDAGRFVYIPTITYTNWPLGMEMLFGWLMALSPVSPTAIVSFLLGIIILALVFSFARRRGGIFAGMVTLCLLLLLNDLWREMTTAMVDVGLTAFATGAILALQRAMQEDGQRRSWERLAACFAGLAATMKLTGLWVVLAVIVAYAWTLRQRRDAAIAARLATFALTAAILAAPWYFKTWILTGNPVYPMLYGVFGGREWTAEGWGRFQLAHLVFNAPPGGDPTSATLWRVHYLIAGVGLTLATVLFVAARRSRYVTIFGTAAIFLGCAACGNYFNPRFLLPVLPSLCFVIGQMLKDRGRILALPCCLVAAGIALDIGIFVLSPTLPIAFRVATGLERRSEYLHAANPLYGVAEFANRKIDRKARILIDGALNYPALFHAEALWDMYNLQDSIHFDSAERLDRDLNRLGVQYIVLTPYPANWRRNVNFRFRRHGENNRIGNLVQRRGILLFQANGCRLYSLRRVP